MSRPVLHPWFAGAAAFSFCLAAALAAESPRAARPLARKVDFAREIQPLLTSRCVACHGPNVQQGGLRLDRSADALKGGGSGPAILPRQGAGSLLVHRVSGADPKKVMPPSGERLTPAQVALLRAWIDQGAEWPAVAGRESAVPGQLSSAHWAFQPVRRPAIPAVRQKEWVRNPIDAFVLARLEKEGIRPSREADPRTLIRRLSLDLLGLPPAPAEVEQFAREYEAERHPSPGPSPRGRGESAGNKFPAAGNQVTPPLRVGEGAGGRGAYERLVDRLLASSHFGERWGRHWLDLSRYADSDGYEKDLPRPYAYLYRDWVINALNRDLPFDQFTIEQLAGDLLPNATLEQKIATGFHRNTLKNREGGVDPEEDRVKCVVDRTSTTATVWLGLTVGCAECHNHKYDPISQKEFYGLYAFFNEAREVDIPAASPEETAAYQQARAAWAAQRDRLQQAAARYEQETLPAKQAAWEQSVKLPEAKLPPRIASLLAKAPESRSRAEKAELTAHFRTVDPEMVRLTAAVVEYLKKEPPALATRAQVFDQDPKPTPTQIHIRGDFLRKGDPVSPHTLAVLPALATGRAAPTRLDLARWLVDPANPLTPRVQVNRAWQHLFGRGLVTTPNDFGTRGDPPSHPELLDWLAARFAGVSGPESQVPSRTSPDPGLGTRDSRLPRPWSLKSLIRLIVTSATYRQASDDRKDLVDRDPRNTLLARQNRYRPEAEVVRDLFLSASGLLNPKIGGPSIRPALPADIAALGYAGSVKWTESKGAERYRRGMYIFFQRTVPYPMLATFDAPDSNVTCTRRERSNTPLQALTLLNDPVFFECAQALGRRVVTEQSGSPADRVRYAFRVCLGREPTATEQERLLRLHAEVQRLSAANLADAGKLAGTGWPPEIQPAEAAAWVVVARTVLNLDEFMTRE